MYSNTVDLLNFGDAILSNRGKLVSEQQKRQWLKPAASTSSWGYSMGMPWEILRSSTLTVNGRLIDIYTKAGDLGLYHGMFALVPDYDIVVSILMAGPEASSGSFSAVVLSDVLRALIPAIDHAARAEAKPRFAGKYVDSASNSSLTISVDDGPGLVLSNWTVRGVDVLLNIPSYSLTPSSKRVPISARLYPTNLRSSSGDQQTWRAVYQVGSDEDFAKLDERLFMPDGSCVTWGKMDRVNYNYAGLDEFLVSFAKDGTVVGINPQAFDVTIAKAS
jgi:hypothetical protein